MSDLQGGPLVDIMVLLLNSRSKKPEQHHMKFPPFIGPKSGYNKRGFFLRKYHRQESLEEI